ncbi:hypothetical protein [Haloarchaeobius sp. DT45]|uniref:hypothetical protein n=1 Tax=Haloarchaeobius sp. DT45 TaxID=3446116 RepID=UPI003F6ABB6B
MRTDTHTAAQQYRPTTDQTPTDIDTTPTGTDTGETSADTSPTGATDTDPTDTPAGWVARCQRSFDSTDTGRLTNTTDEANQAMPTTD